VMIAFDEMHRTGRRARGTVERNFHFEWGDSTTD
jgi:hypothetical protein